MKIVLAVFFVFISTIDAHSVFSDFKIEGPAEVGKKVKLYFTPNEEVGYRFVLKNLPQLMDSKAFNVSRPTVIYFHGWWESGEFDLSVFAVRGAYLNRGDHNVISVDWGYYSKNMNYYQVVPQTKVIAKVFAEQLRDLVFNGFNISSLHLVGHSLGAQIVGTVGRDLKALTLGKLSVPRIFALDPAGVGYEGHVYIDGVEPISRFDGDYVQVIHTNGGEFGMLNSAGSADFYPDGGSDHPGCNVDALGVKFEQYQKVCNHARSWHFYQESVRNPLAFPAVRCRTYDGFLENDEGDDCNRTNINYLGFGADPSLRGRYYLETNGNMFNLPRGKFGLYHMNANITDLPIKNEIFD